MGLFDQLANMIGGEKINQLNSVLGWVDEQGGIQGLVEKFSQNNLADVIQSWIGDGANLPINAEQISQIFSTASISELANNVGFNAQETTSLIAQYLPKLVDKVTPNGEIPENLDIASVGMSFLKEKLFG